jgi:FkbM family methyltransferase
MWIRDTFDVLTRHPLNRDHRLKAFTRWARWQTSSLLAPGPIAVPYVNDIRLLARFGMTSATGNIYAGLYEFEDMAFVGHLLRPGDLFVDVGANVGCYSMLAAAVGARSLALEPLPTTFRDLMMNVSLNGVHDLVDARNVGVGAEHGELVFTEAHDSMNHVAVGSESGLTVAVETLDHLLAGNEPRFIKIDVEGYEAAVLAGAAATLAKPSLVGLLVEFVGHGTRYGYDEIAVHANLLRLGFSPMVYKPFERRVVPPSDSTDRTYASNTLYLRSTDEVKALVAAAPGLRLPQRTI